MKIDEAIEYVLHTRLVLSGEYGEGKYTESLDMAIEALETIANGYVPDGFMPIGYHDKVYAELQKRYFDLLERTRWIPVSERLPDVKQAILATNGISRYTTTYLPELDNSFTHWMPLPEPPETTREEAGHWDGIAPLQEV